MLCLCLDPSLTGTGFALMQVPLPADENGVNALDKIIVRNVVGIIENKDASEPEQTRVKRLYEEIWKVLNLCAAVGAKVHLIAAEMAPHLYGQTQKHEKAIRFQFASYTIVRLVAAHAQLPLLECNPEWSKRAAVGAERASKAEVKRMMGFRCLGGMDIKWPIGYGEDVIDALTVGFWLDSLWQSQKMGETTPLAPFVPQELAARS